MTSPPTTPNTKFSSPCSTPKALVAPNAPTKGKVEKLYRLDNIRKLTLPADDEEESVCEKECPDLTGVRWKYLQYDTDDVMEITSTKFLHQLWEWYTPNSQPRTMEEWEYIDKVRLAVEERLKQLNCFCYLCEARLWDDIDDEDLLKYMP
jgi:hypothetical protein